MKNLMGEETRELRAGSSSCANEQLLEGML